MLREMDPEPISECPAEQFFSIWEEPDQWVAVSVLPRTGPERWPRVTARPPAGGSRRLPRVLWERAVAGAIPAVPLLRESPGFREVMLRPPKRQTGLNSTTSGIGAGNQIGFDRL